MHYIYIKVYIHTHLYRDKNKHFVYPACLNISQSVFADERENQPQITTKCMCVLVVVVSEPKKHELMIMS